MSLFFHLPRYRTCWIYAAALSGLLVVSGQCFAETKFDHFSTGFPITGLHSQVECDGCHIKGVFKGTPQDCNICHNGQMAPGKPANHVLSTGTCDNCHSTFSWSTVALDHSSVVGSCRSCHDGVTAPGKHANHVTTTAECDNCHGTIAWVPVNMDHDVVVGTCRQCHNGVTATGQHPQHIQTTSECDSCHTTRAWLPATGFDHSNVAGRCSQSGCHANDKPNNHIPTVEECNVCHRTTGWLPAFFDHDSAALGSCQGCHLKDRPTVHFVSVVECSSCHRTTAWLPSLSASEYAHNSNNYPGNHNISVVCLTCHTNFEETNIWRTVNYKPDCAGCHASKYVPDPHKKTESPESFYTVGELADCANGSCHLSKGDGSVVTPPPEHRVSDSQF